MTQKNLLTLVLIVGVLMASALFLERSPQGGADAGGPWLGDLEANLSAIDTVTVSKAGPEVLATLKKTDSGWVVAERDNYPANLGQLRSVLSEMAEATILERKTANPELIGRLGLDDLDADTASGFGLKVSGGEFTADVILGNATNDQRYVRSAGDPQSWLVDKEIEVPDEVAGWLDNEIVDVSADDVASVTIQHPGGPTIVASKVDASAANFDVADVPADRELLYDGIANASAGVLDNLTLDDVAATGDASQDAVTTVFDLRSGAQITVESFELDDASWIRLSATGAEQGDNDESWATSLNEQWSGWRYEIPSYKFDQLTRTWDDLLKNEDDEAMGPNP